MIIGIGTDIIQVSRIKESMAANPRFAERIFTPDEISYCESRALKHQSYAARFAAKEAVMKALGTGWDGKINWIDIEVVSNDLGDPGIRVYGMSKTLMEQRNISKIHLSLSHEKDFAIAYVILEGGIDA